MPFRLWLPVLWRRRGPLNRLLLPFSWLYALSVRVRRACYNRGIFRVTSFPRPVVVVGGISVGGSGKTPVVMHVAALLKENGWSPGIVSRGYGGRSPRIPLVVNAGTPVSESGDEPAMMASRLGVPVVVDTDRPRGVNVLIDTLECNVVVSDDGLQHYAMDRVVEIVVLADDTGNGWCLPAGPLREPLSRAAAADLKVRAAGAAGVGEYQAAFELGELEQLDGGGRRPLSALKGRRVHAVAGTGDPERFFGMLADLGLNVVKHPFPDHHPYASADFRSMTDAPIVMTEKDAVKCRSLALNDAWFAPLRVTLEGGFDKKLIELLKP